MELTYFKQLLIDKTPHAILRYGDGEKNIFNRENCNRKGFKYDSEKDEEFRQQLLDSYNFRSPNYYVADNNLVSACLFVNQNYERFLKEYTPLLNLFDVIYVGNETSNINNLPFKVSKFFPITDEAWKNFPRLHFYVLQELINYDKPSIILIAGGPYSNVLIHRLWRRNKNHIYINIGSVYDPLVYEKNTRKYHERMFAK